MYVEVDELRRGSGEVGFTGRHIEYRKREASRCACWDNFVPFFSVPEHSSGPTIKYDRAAVLENVRKITGSLARFVT